MYFKYINIGLEWGGDVVVRWKVNVWREELCLRREYFKTSNY